jgi:hypothetical protein
MSPPHTLRLHHAASSECDKKTLKKEGFFLITDEDNE